MDSAAPPQQPRFKPETAHKFAKSVFIANGVPPDNAEIVARCLVAADLRGVDTHGINRVPSYIARVRAGMLDPKGTPTLEMKTPVVGQVDGKNAFGALSATLAIDTAIKSAEQFGIGMVSVTHSNHYGMAAWIVQRGIDAGMMSLVFTNSSPAMPAWGAKEKLIGTSPLACGAPAGKAPPFILDMAPTVAARGKVYKAKRRGEKIPLDWALDADGAQTDDPARALEGVMLPMGGPKGSGLAIMMDVFSGVLSGSAFAGGVAGPYETNRPADVGHFIVAIKPDLFLDLEEFKSRMDFLYKKVVSSQKMVGVDRVFFPGEIEQLQEAERRKLGIPFAIAEVDLMNEEAARAGVAPLQSDA